MIFPVNHQQLLSGNKMEKSNYKEWSVDFNGKIIKVSNWWNWEGKSSADLYLDNDKSLIIKNASKENVCIMHNHILLDDEFLRNIMIYNL